jgi:CHAT domain-containing protein
VLPKKLTQLIFAPDGELALVPFEALRPDGGNYLIERLAVSYVSSGRDLMPRPEPRGKTDLALVLANPDFDQGGDKDSRPASSPPGHLRSNDFNQQKLVFKPLPGFAREARAVAKLFQGHKDWSVRSWLGADASEEKLAAVRRPRLLYFITHGFFLADMDQAADPSFLRGLKLVDLGPVRPKLPDPGFDPRLRSGLALAGANRWKERSRRGLSDGLLTALEVENLDLWGTELVVLSACETGLGKVQVGEGVLGLRRAFQLAGARTVLAALWKVPDAETESLMKKFFQGWLKGAPKAEALRQAQLDLVKELRQSKDAARRKAPPLNWAGFICHGQLK